MAQAKYDQAADFYNNFVERALADPNSVLSVVSEHILKAVQPVAEQQLCDVACGQGHLSRQLAEQGAHVTAVDISTKLLEYAKELTTDGLSIRCVHDDAQSLDSLNHASFDKVVINMALMDIPDFKRAFESCYRILKTGGRFVFSVLHPCFESPFDVEAPPIELSPSGDFVACRVSRYLEEGHWTSGGTGVRGRVGAHHRTLSSYLNTLLASGFSLHSIAELALPAGDYSSVEEQWFCHIPKGLVVTSYK